MEYLFQFSFQLPLWSRELLYQQNHSLNTRKSDLKKKIIKMRSTDKRYPEQLQQKIQQRKGVFKHSFERKRANMEMEIAWKSSVTQSDTYCVKQLLRTLRTIDDHALNYGLISVVC